MTIDEKLKSHLFDDIWIYLENVRIADTRRRQQAIQNFSKGRNHRLQFEREPDNSSDPNAIRVNGYTKGFFGEKEYLLGYVPKEISRTIVEGGFINHVGATLAKINNQGKVVFDLVGVKEKEKDFKEYFEQVLVDVGFVI